MLASLTPAFAPPDPLPSQRAWLERQGLRARLESLPGRPALAVPHFELPPGDTVSIIICSHDQPRLLNTCLESVFGLTRGIDFEVVLVDHASRQQATRQLIADWQRKEPRRLLVERAEGAFNFSSLNNAGVRRARGRYLTLLNNDIEVISPDWLLEMAGWAQRPTVGVVGACLLYPNDTIQHAGILLGMRDLAVHAMKGRRASDPGFMQRLRVPSNFLALTGACLMLRRELYAELGGLDERFAVAGGDIDLCLQASARGFFNLLLPQVRLYHYESATRGFEDSPAKQARLRQEYDLLRQRWPAQVSDCDPFYHPALERVRGDF
jgi:GT2 family glycosyltransferase